MADITDAGDRVEDIDVTISYRIINLFSGQLYQSPAKAIEELVVNSYDAFAHTCHTIIPRSGLLDKRIIVYDDGNSMNAEGFEALWKIAESTKRDDPPEGRLPIGKFGIGKLATYVLANKLTYICKKGGKIRAVTMDYTLLNPAAEEGTELSLDVRELTEDVAQDVLTFNEAEEHGIELPLFGDDAPDNWTVAVLSELKDKANDLHFGRLRWVVSTALPRVPDFDVFLNGERIAPTKEDIPIVKEWTLGQSDEVADNLDLETTIMGEDDVPAVVIPGIGTVWGTSELYEDTLTRGKAAQIGRSHGIFVMVRGRLINHDDDKFGIPPLSHQTLNRYRLVIHADGLDKLLVASREGVSSSPAVDQLRGYIRAKFNEARSYYQQHQKKLEYEQRLSTKLGSLPSSLIGRPLRNLVEQTLHDEVPAALTRVPADGSTEARESLQLKIDEAKEIPQSLLHDVKPRGLGNESPLAVFEAGEGFAYLNTDHPYFVNYSESISSSEPFDVIGLAEILTEAFLRDHGVPPEVAAEVIDLRDSLLRQIVSVRPISATAIAARLRDAGSDQKILEEAVGDGFKALGFDVTRMGETGKPDGLARARLGYVSDAGGEGTYTAIYDAKSTSANKAKTSNLNLGTVAQHQEDHKAEYAVVVAKDFQASQEGDELAIRAANKHGITLVRCSDLADLVEARAAKFLSLHKLSDFFEQCRTPEESREWIHQAIDATGTPPPVRDLLDVIYELQKDGRDNVSLGDVKQYKGRLSGYSKAELSNWCSGLNSLVPTLIVFDQGTRTVEMHARPEKVLSAITDAVYNIPDRIAKEMKDALDDSDEDVET